MAMSAILVLILLLLAILGSGVWIGLALTGLAWVAMDVFTQQAIGDAMAMTIWGSLSSWTLTALPLFVWMGEILFRTRLSDDLFNGLAPWLTRLPGRLLHANTIGSTIFAAVSGSSAATCITVGKMTLPELEKRGYSEKMAVSTLAGASTLGLLIPPSIMMIVYGVMANVSITKLFVAGVVPGLMLAGLFMAYTVVWALLNPSKVPHDHETYSLREKLYASRRLIPVLLLISCVLGSIYLGIATATEAAAIGVASSLALALFQRELTWAKFIDGVLGACRLYCMIALILAGSAFLTLAMGYMGLPRHLAEGIGAMGLTPGHLLLLLTIFFIILGCFLDGISIVVLTITVLMPTIQQAGIDPIWFGIFLIVIVEMAQITPPVGFNLFVLQGITKREITWLARVALAPFLLLSFGLLLLYIFPNVVLWLPGRI